MLSILIFFPIAAAILALTFASNAKQIALVASLVELALSLYITTGFSPSSGTQFMQDQVWISSLGVHFKIGVDGISLLLVLLTTALYPLIILASYKHEFKNPGFFYCMVLTMQMALIGVFTALDGFLFYVFWELALIPVYLICLLWGGRDSGRITLKFFIYTLFGSLLMLVALIWLWAQTPAPHTFDIEAFYNLNLSPIAQSWIFWALFLAFAIKIPVFPFHTWQPDTYTDAPVTGTMLLSGIMLKMGIYGVIRWMLPVIPEGVSEWKNTALLLSVIGIIYASIIAFTQKDFKRLIAYSSIAHVGLISAGIFSLSYIGLQGGMIQMFSHGINIVGLFFIAEIIFNRMQTRQLDQLGGIRNVAPQFATVFMIIVLASIALPLTNGFVGEFLLLNGIFQTGATWAAIGGLTIILGAVYMLSAYQKISLGEKNSLTAGFIDLTLIEKVTFIPILVAIFWIGIYPKPILDLTGPSIAALQQLIQH